MNNENTGSVDMADYYRLMAEGATTYPCTEETKVSVDVAELAKIAAAAKNQAKDDPVDHPAHYTSHPSGVECIDIAKWYDFCVGNAIKYIWRAGLKHSAVLSDDEKQLEDLKKARWYLSKEIEELEAKLNKK